MQVLPLHMQLGRPPCCGTPLTGRLRIALALRVALLAVVGFNLARGRSIAGGSRVDMHGALYLTCMQCSGWGGTPAQSAACMVTSWRNRPSRGSRCVHALPHPTPLLPRVGVVYHTQALTLKSLRALQSKAKAVPSAVTKELAKEPWPWASAPAPAAVAASAEPPRYAVAMPCRRVKCKDGCVDMWAGWAGAFYVIGGDMLTSGLPGGGGGRWHCIPRPLKLKPKY